MNTIVYVLLAVFAVLFIFSLIIDIKANMYVKMTFNRIIIIFDIIIICYFIYIKNFFPAVTGISTLIGYFIGSVFSDKMSCPYCGRRYGIKVWFMNNCPHCKVHFKKIKKHATKP